MGDPDPSPESDQPLGESYHKYVTSPWGVWLEAETPPDHSNRTIQSPRTSPMRVTPSPTRNMSISLQLMPRPVKKLRAAPPRSATASPG